jgi:hypothetical protein
MIQVSQIIDHENTKTRKEEEEEEEESRNREEWGAKRRQASRIRLSVSPFDVRIFLGSSSSLHS